ncbi:MAG: hypothetical protein KBF21_09825 [Thermoanaerobaculia bacterium]|nr:hypothetical protein [Thermoanaerobaculia bacterium]MBP9824509.1 hypothetical protein [Thermoanaerobaculia bacterium]
MPSAPTCFLPWKIRLLRTARLSISAIAVVASAFGVLSSAVEAQLVPPPVPPGNPLTPSKVRLGKALFWDEQLSSPRTVACGTCHIPSAGGTDPRSAASPLAIHPGPDGLFGGADDVLGSPGVPRSGADGLYSPSLHFGLTEQATGRRAPSSLNAGYSPTLFWDGRAAGQFLDPVTSEVVLAAGGALESQSVGPPVSDVEMAHVGRTWTEILARLAAASPLALAARAPAALLDWIDGRAYAALFEEAFGTPDITAPRVAMAIASYERTQFTNQAPFDAFIGGDDAALTPLESAGRDVFVSASCDRCHRLAIMSDHDFHYIGVRPPAEDPGRFAITNDDTDLGKTRTPSLRNLELRAPYMKNGRFATIEQVVDFYDRGGDFEADNKDPFVRVLNLVPAEKAALAAFLKRPLTDPRLVPELPPFDRPKLFSESGRAAVIEGVGLPGSGGLVPSPVALEPPVLGNPGFTVALQGGLGGATAVLAISDTDPGLVTPGSGDFAFEIVVLDGVGAGQGYGSVSLAIPADPALAGRELFGRWYVADTGGGQAEAVTPLFRFTLFPPLGATIVFIDGFETADLSDWG